MMARIGSISLGAAAKWSLEERALESAQTTRLDQRISVPKPFLVALSVAVKCIARSAAKASPIQSARMRVQKLPTGDSSGFSFFFLLFAFLCHPRRSISLAAYLLSNNELIPQHPFVATTKC